MARLGLGALEALAQQPATGTVIAAFRKATYVRFPGGLVALTAPDVPPGPLHLCADRDQPLGPLRCRDRVGVADNWLYREDGGGGRLAVGGAAVWRGQLPDTLFQVEVLQGAAEGSALPDRSEMLSSIAAGDLEATANILGGLGPGLTPSGDDALAGILLMARIKWSAAAEGRLLAVARAVRTHEIALSFLAWAARGQSNEAVHQCLTARDLASARRAAAALTAIGHTSGHDIARGLVWGWQLLPARDHLDVGDGPEGVGHVTDRAGPLQQRCQLVQRQR